MKNSYLVFGNRYCGWDEIIKWILDHKDVSYHVTDVEHAKKGTMTSCDGDTVFSYYPETSLVYHEDILFNSNLATYRKTIIVYRDIKDVIAKILKNTRINIDKVVNKQVYLFEDYTDELIGESSKIHEPYFMPIFYDKWRYNIDYRNDIANQLGFVNTYKDAIEREYNLKDRQKVRYIRQITQRVKELNNRI